MDAAIIMDKDLLYDWDDENMYNPVLSFVLGNIFLSVMVEALHKLLSVDSEDIHYDQYGRRWIRLSMSDWKSAIPSKSESSLRRAVRRLRECGAVYVEKCCNGRTHAPYYSVNYAFFAKKEAEGVKGVLAAGGRIPNSRLVELGLAHPGCGLDITVETPLEDIKVSGEKKNTTVLSAIESVPPVDTSAESSSSDMKKAAGKSCFDEIPSAESSVENDPAMQAKKPAAEGKPQAEKWTGKKKPAKKPAARKDSKIEVVKVDFQPSLIDDGNEDFITPENLAGEPYTEDNGLPSEDVVPQDPVDWMKADGAWDFLPPKIAPEAPKEKPKPKVYSKDPEWKKMMREKYPELYKPTHSPKEFAERMEKVREAVSYEREQKRLEEEAEAKERAKFQQSPVDAFLDSVRDYDLICAWEDDLVEEASDKGIIDAELDEIAKACMDASESAAEEIGAEKKTREKSAKEAVKKRASKAKSKPVVSENLQDDWGNAEISDEMKDVPEWNRMSDNAIDKIMSEYERRIHALDDEEEKLEIVALANEYPPLLVLHGIAQTAKNKVRGNSAFKYVEKVVQSEYQRHPEKWAVNDKPLYGESVHLSDDEYAKLLDYFGDKETVNRHIKWLDHYKNAQGKEFVSDYHAILSYDDKREQSETIKEDKKKREAEKKHREYERLKKEVGEMLARNKAEREAEEADDSVQ